MAEMVVVRVEPPMYEDDLLVLHLMPAHGRQSTAEFLAMVGQLVTIAPVSPAQPN